MIEEKIKKSALWNMDDLYCVPKIYPTNLYAVEHMKSFFYEGLVYQGRKNKVYAYYKAPDGNPPLGGWPAVVLVHGGGGTAFPWMVKKWNEYGYAAISMDLEGHLPDAALPNDQRQNHEGSGPNRKGVFEDYTETLSDQWFYHAVADIVLAHTLVRSFPEINPEKTGIFGVSWGGIITCVIIGIDHRFKFAIPVYGCGYLDEADGVLRTTPEQSKLWDPGNFLPQSTIPALFINGTNDKHFPLNVWHKTTQLINDCCWRFIKVRMEHSHSPGLEIKETFAFADSIAKNGKPLLEVKELEFSGENAKAKVTGETDIKDAVLCYTTDSGVRSGRIWLETKAQISGDTLYSKIPEGTKAIFFNVTDARGLMVCSEYIELS